MKRLLLVFTFVAFQFFSIHPDPVKADGIIIPDPPICPLDGCPPDIIPMEQLAIRYHHVEVHIQNQVAITHVDQVFYNPNDWQIEGTYIFPIPTDAVVNDFILWIDGKPVEGQVLDASQARQKYEEIVNSLKDPALLEYVGRGAVQARVFPIPPGGERRIELEYSQVLLAENGLVKYTYPLNTEKFSVYPLESVIINIDIQSSESIRAVYSPSHNINIDKLDENHAIAGYEASNMVPETDFTLYYSIGESEAFHLLTYRDPTDLVDPDGFFLLLLAPRPETDAPALSKDIILVLDQSGSMEGEKFQQAQSAVRYILEHLKQDDRFNILTFSTSVDSYSDEMTSSSNAASAINWVDRQSAMGSTDINRALLEAVNMTDGEHPAYIIFLTDGLPTEGETDSQRILDNLSYSARSNVRLFTFGVGYDVDTFLLDSLSQENHGTSTYVQPGDQLDEVLSSFYARISTPVLTNLELDFGDLTPYDVFPNPLPDLFAGSQIVVTGRYHQDGMTGITLKGEINGQEQTFTYDRQVFPNSNTSSLSSSLPRLWATRKIGHLLNQVRLDGPNEEIIDQIVKLSIRYGIVTPYTSYLVTEDMPLGAAEQDRISSDQYSNFMATTTPSTSGAPAVQQAADQGKMSAAESVDPSGGLSTELVKQAGSHTFVYIDGTWVDTVFDPDTMLTKRVPFLSEDYFDLSAYRPELAAAFALGQNVIVVSGGIAYQVVGSEETGDPIEIPATITPGSGGSGQPGGTTQPASAPPSKNLCGSSLLALLPIGLLLYKKSVKK